MRRKHYKKGCCFSAFEMLKAGEHTEITKTAMQQNILLSMPVTVQRAKMY